MLKTVLITPAALLPTRCSCLKYLSKCSTQYARSGRLIPQLHRELTSTEDIMKLSPSIPLSFTNTHSYRDELLSLHPSHALLSLFHQHSHPLCCTILTHPGWPCLRWSSSVISQARSRYLILSLCACIDMEKERVREQASEWERKINLLRWHILSVVTATPPPGGPVVNSCLAPSGQANTCTISLLKIILLRL